jgi:uncharacterized Zn finger protein
MAESTVSQVQQNPFKTLADEQMARVEAVNDEITKLQHKTFAQVQSATAEAIKLWTGSFEYATQLSNDYRKLALEATRQGLALATSTPRV